MANSFFQFKQFIIHQERCAMKVTTDACLFGAVVANDVQNKGRLLDIGTGTGLLSLMVVQKNNDLSIDAIEIDSEAARQAAENINLSPWKDSIKVINEDIRTYLTDNQYDYIISNPPFYENELKGVDAAKNIAHHGNELSFQELVTITSQQLSPKGRFYFLLPYKRKKEVLAVLSKHSFFIHTIISVRQSTSHDIFRLIISGGFDNLAGKEKEIAIRDDEGEYTEEFVWLLKDYYLYL